jgi:hypothetical protein
MTPSEIEKHIRDLNRPASSPALRARVLAHAPAAAVPVLWSDRLWFSRTFRWSAAAAAVVLLALAARTAPHTGAPQIAGRVAAETEAITAVARDAGLPNDAAASLATRAVATRRSASSPSTAAALQAIVETGGGH